MPGLPRNSPGTGTVKTLGGARGERVRGLARCLHWSSSLQAFLCSLSLTLECEAPVAKGCLFSNIGILTFFSEYQWMGHNHNNEHIKNIPCLDTVALMGSFLQFSLGDYCYTHCADKETEANKN